MTIITPVLLAGGLGTRLWPLSRKSYPKQFSNLIGEKTLFQDSANRLTSSSILRFEKHIVVSNSDFRFLIAEQLQQIGIDPGAILIEPEPKNTAAAILAACLYLFRTLILLNLSRFTPDPLILTISFLLSLNLLKKNL